MPTGSSWEIKTAVSVEVSLGPDRAEPSCRAKASAGLAEILILPVYTGVMDQPDQGDTEKQQIPSLWCLLIVGIKSKKKNFPPFTLAVVTCSLPFAELSVSLGEYQAFGFHPFGEGDLCCSPHCAAGCNIGLGLVQFCSQPALIGFSTSSFVPFRSLCRYSSD